MTGLNKVCECDG